MTIRCQDHIHRTFRVVRIARPGREEANPYGLQCMDCLEPVKVELTFEEATSAKTKYSKELEQHTCKRVIEGGKTSAQYRR